MNYKALKKHLNFISQEAATIVSVNKFLKVTYKKIMCFPHLVCQVMPQLRSRKRKGSVTYGFKV